MPGPNRSPRPRPLATIYTFRYKVLHHTLPPFTRTIPLRPFLVCVHDATPAYEHETRIILRDLSPLVGRRLSFGVVPDWRSAWPLAAHPQYCRLIDEHADELLLHGYFHERQRGWGPVSLLAERSDEMNGLDLGETRDLLSRGQRAFTELFGREARGFLPPAWQAGHARQVLDDTTLDYVLGFTALDARTPAIGSTNKRRVLLSTWTWDCGRFDWLGHIGDGVGRALFALDSGVPTLAIHPRDVSRGFWPRIMKLTREMLAKGYTPVTPSDLLRSNGTTDASDASESPERAA